MNGMATDARVTLIETTTHGRVLVRTAPRHRATLIGFHGYAEAAEAQLRRLEAIPDAQGWTLVSVQGLNRFYRGRSEEVAAGWMTREDREVAIADNIAYVNRVIDALGESCGPAGNLVYAGFSQGTAMAFRAAVRGRAPACGVIAVGGDVPPELLADPGASFPPVFLARGGRDEWYTQAKLDTDVAALRSRGVRVTPLVFDGAHEWSSFLNHPVASFLRGLVESS
jgi:predicted esterase